MGKPKQQKIDFNMIANYNLYQIVVNSIAIEVYRRVNRFSAKVNHVIATLLEKVSTQLLTIFEGK